MANSCIVASSVPQSRDYSESIRERAGEPGAAYDGLQVTVNLSAMSNRQQMNLILIQLEGVNDSIIADASTKTVRSFQPVMRKRCEGRFHQFSLQRAAEELVAA